MHLSEESSNGVIVGYQISLRAVNLNGSYTEAANASALRYDVTGMDPNTFYYIKIKAVNKAGSGPPCILSAQTMSKGNSVHYAACVIEWHSVAVYCIMFYFILMCYMLI